MCSNTRTCLLIEQYKLFVKKQCQINSQKICLGKSLGEGEMIDPTVIMWHAVEVLTITNVK